MRSKNSAPASIVWLRLDLRLEDQPALAAALNAGGPVVPVFIWAPEEESPWVPGAASRWWLHHALADLDAQLRARGSRLIFRTGPSAETLLAIARETAALRIFWCRRYEPALLCRDEKVSAALHAAGLWAESFGDALLFDPEKISNQAGQPFKVFTAFWRHCLKQPRPVMKNVLLKKFAVSAPKKWPQSVALDSLKLLPEKKWGQGFYNAWEPTRVGARRRLRKFSSDLQTRYATERNIPALDGTSRLSPYLHFGQISPREAWVAGAHSAKFLAELGWREFSHHLLYHFPSASEKPLRAEFLHFPWRRNKRLLQAWQHGRTGYPIVDAGMRQLWQTGWMHNRVRMICASVLVKHLEQPWTEGAAWFWDTLVDADLANNSLGWQWVAGCGADAAPFFRVFNPALQGARFDPAGDYIRQYVPELAKLPSAFIHAPWQAPEKILSQAGVCLGKNYPQPIVDHHVARHRALWNFQKMRALRKPTAS